MKKLIDILKELKTLKWKNMKSIEKKFIIVTIVFVILLIISQKYIFFSMYANILKNPDELKEFMIVDTKYLKLYHLPHNIKKVLYALTPNAYTKAIGQYSIYLMILLIIWVFTALPIKFPKDVSHGSARWSKFDDLGYSGFFLPTTYARAFEMNLLEERGVVLGEFNNRILRDNGKTHILLSAPTRTGKGVSVIIPTLVDTWNDSVLVLDVKGENYQMTAGWRQKEFKNKILKFSPKKEDSCKFNPIEEIRYLTEKEVEDAQVIAKLIAVGDTQSSDPFWENSAADFILGVIMFKLYEKRGKAGLGDVVDFITDPSRPIEDRMRSIFCVDEDEYKPLFDKNIKEDREIMDKLKEIYPLETEVIETGQHPFVSRAMADMVQKGDKTMQSIIATAKTSLSVFELPTVKANTSKSDFKILDLMAGKDPISLYIVIEPGDLQALAPLLRILIIQCVTLLTPEIDYTGHSKNTVKFNHRLLMLLDEFPSIGKMEILEKAIGYVAGYGMKMMLVVQSLDQLNKIYTKDNAFLSNCQTQVFYTTNENQTSEYISKTIGQETIITKSRTGGLKGSTTINKSGRDLLKAEEMRRFPLNQILLLVGGKFPIKTKKILFFKDKRFKHKIKLPIDPTDGMKAEMEIQKGD